MKIVINRQFGGFGLSPLALKRLAELHGRPCYFFLSDLKGNYTPVDVSELGNKRIEFWSAFTVPNPSEVLPSQANWSAMSLEERQASNAAHSAVSIEQPRSDAERSDPMLVRVVEEMGDAANGAFAKLEIVEVPDDIKWEISEYDGMEHVEEVHRSWP